jgi:hypothetical protein
MTTSLIVQAIVALAVLGCVSALAAVGVFSAADVLPFVGTVLGWAVHASGTIVGSNAASPSTNPGTTTTTTTTAPAPLPPAGTVTPG